MEIAGSVFDNSVLLLIIYLILVCVLGIRILIRGRQRSFNRESIASVVENVNEAILVVSPDSRIEFTNSAAQKLFKYTNEELLGKKPDQLFEKDEAILKTTETNCIDANNDKIPVEIYVKELYDNSKHYQGWVYAVKDISEIRRYKKIVIEKTKDLEQKEIGVGQFEQELQNEKISTNDRIKQHIADFEEEQEMLLASISNLSVGFIITDKSKNIILHNKAAQNILPSLGVKSKTIDELKCEQINYNLNESIDKSIGEGKVVTVTDAQINSKFVNIFISPIIPDISGKDAGKTDSTCQGTVIIIEDKSVEHRLEESQEELFSIASHELRTPLTAIYGYTSLIKQIYFGNFESEELKKIINNIGLLSKKLFLSVNNFLDFSKLEKGKIELKKGPCDLYTLINEAITETERLAMEKGLYIKFDSRASLMTVIGDQIRLRQVLIILLVNAIKFTQNGGVSISMQKQGDFALVRIQDTGSGIYGENKMLLFSKFQQDDENFLTRQEGTGLGLRTARLLVEKMGGFIRLEKTELNIGSTFSFTVPLKID